jgi:hypothetical protein
LNDVNLIILEVIVKKRFFVILFLVCFAVSIAGAQANWQTINSASASDLEGRWEGSFTMNVPPDPAQMIPKSSIDINMSLFCTSSNYLMSMVFNLEKFLDDLMNIPDVKGSGVTKELFWMIMAAAMESQIDGTGLKISEGNYSMSISMTGNINELLSEENPQGEVFINDNRNIIRLVFNEKMTLGMGDEGISEIILHKK